MQFETLTRFNHYCYLVCPLNGNYFFGFTDLEYSYYLIDIFETFYIIIANCSTRSDLNLYIRVANLFDIMAIRITADFIKIACSSSFYR